jgi:DNA mismatch repair protein MutL
VAAREWLIDVAQHLETLGDRATSERLREEAIAQAACKAAVKARDHLTLAEVEQLVVALAATEMPYTCPHGRPTLIYTSFAELERKFGRA